MRARMFAPVLIATALAAAAFAAQQEISAKASAPAETKPGKQFGVTVTVTIPDGHYIYANKLDGDLGVPTSLKVKAPAGVKVGAVKWPKPKTKEALGQTLAYWDGTVKFTVPVTATTKNVGKNSFNVDVRYQMCNDRICLPPQTAKATATTVVKK